MNGRRDRARRRVDAAARVNRRGLDLVWSGHFRSLLDLENFFLFTLRGLVQLPHVPVGHLLDLVMRATVLVFRDDLVLEELFDRLVPIAPDVADGHAMILGYGVELLDQILAALFGQRRNRNADELAVVRR